MKSQKELAFLREISLTDIWTKRFTDLADKNLVLPKKGNVLYLNAGTGFHAMELREKLKKEVKLVCVCENKALFSIAKAKVSAINAEIAFARFADLNTDSFDAVIADLSFTPKNELGEFIEKALTAAKKGGAVSFFLPTAGSFGEIFSVLWEALVNSNAINKAAEFTQLIKEIPTVTEIEESATNIGLILGETKTENEFFEYKDGEELLESILIKEFMFPVWLDFSGTKERNSVLKEIVKIIANEHDGLSFRISIKTSFFSGIKQ